MDPEKKHVCQTMTPTRLTASPPRVCMFVYNNFTNDSRVQKEAETLIQAGYRVTVLALLDEQTSTKEDRGGVKIVRVNVNPWYRRFLGGGLLKAVLYSLFGVAFIESLIWLGDLTRLNRALVYGCMGIFTVTLTLLCRRLYGSPTIFLKNLLMFFHREYSFFSFYCTTYKIAAEERHDIYHAHDLNTLPVAYLAARRDKAKLVYDSHELYVERNKLESSSKLWKFFLRRVESFLARRADAVITVNEALAGIMAKWYGIPQPSVIMNTPAKLEQTESLLTTGGDLLRNALGISPRMKLLLYVGRITFNRGLEQLISSLSQLEDCSLVCMGGGNEDYKKDLLSFAKETGVDDRFFFFGPVPSDKVIRFAAGADLGIAAIANSCLSYYYCSPNKLFEYMNAGLPVIASAFPELERVVLQHEIGLTFDPSDPEDIARAVRQILDDSKTRERMRQNAFEAAHFYNWENESTKLLQIYASLSTSCR